MSEGNDELKITTLVRLLNTSSNVLSTKSQSSPSLPNYVLEFVHHVLNSKINLRDRFRRNLTTKLISIQDFHKFLIESKFKTMSGLDRVVGYFRDKKDPNQVSLSKVVVTIRKMDKNYLREGTDEYTELI